MSRLPVVSGAVAVRVSATADWFVGRQKGRHVILTKPHRKANLSIPLHRELDPGTLRGLIRDSGMTVAEFVALLQTL